RENIVITEIPYQVNKATLIKRIAELAQNKKIDGIADVRDESDRDGMRIVVELKRGEESQLVLNNLYKHTQMQESFGMIMLAIAAGRPKVQARRNRRRNGARDYRRPDARSGGCDPRITTASPDAAFRRRNPQGIEIHPRTHHGAGRDSREREKAEGCNHRRTEGNP